MPAHNSPLTVLIVIDSLGAGGAERSLAESLPYFRAAGIRPVIACLKRKPGVEARVLQDGYDVRFLPESRRRLGSSLFDSFQTRVRALRRLITTEQPALVHTTLLQSNLIGRVAAVGLDVPLLSSLVNTPYAPERVHSAGISVWKTRAIQLLDAATARLLTDRFHAITEAVKEAAVRDLKIAASRITVAERGRSAERLGAPSPERRRRARAALGLDEDAEIVVSVGRQDHQKGQRYLLEAMQPLLRERMRLTLLVAGRRGDRSSELERMQQHPNLDGRVHFLGHRDDVPDLLAAADLFTFPSLYEGLGGAVIEAMALGLPIVASDIPALREVVEEGRNALLVPPGTPAPLGRALRTLLDDPERAAAFGRRSRQIFEERFTLERSAARMIDLYFDVAGVPARPAAAAAS